MTTSKYYYNLNRCISDGKTQFDTTNMPKETYEVNGQIYYGSNDLMDLLNEQHETIERLKQNIDELMQFDVEEDLLKENEQLKHQLITLDGLYVSDKEDMSEVWRLDLFSDDAE